MSSSTRQKNYRLPTKTLEQIQMLTDKLGMTETQVVILAIDRLAQKEIKSTDKK